MSKPKSDSATLDKAIEILKDEKDSKASEAIEMKDIEVTVEDAPDRKEEKKAIEEGEPFLTRIRRSLPSSYEVMLYFLIMSGAWIGIKRLTTPEPDSGFPPVPDFPDFPNSNSSSLVNRTAAEIFCSPENIARLLEDFKKVICNPAVSAAIMEKSRMFMGLIGQAYAVSGAVNEIFTNYTLELNWKTLGFVGSLDRDNFGKLLTYEDFENGYTLPEHSRSMARCEIPKDVLRQDDPCATLQAFSPTPMVEAAFKKHYGRFLAEMEEIYKTGSQIIDLNGYKRAVKQHRNFTDDFIDYLVGTHNMSEQAARLVSPFAILSPELSPQFYAEDYEIYAEEDEITPSSNAQNASGDPLGESKGRARV